MANFSPMVKESEVVVDTTKTLLITNGEDMETTASTILGKIDTELTLIKDKLADMSSMSDTYWKEEAGDMFRGGINDMMGTLNNVVAELSNATNKYQKAGTDAISLVENNKKSIESAL